MFLLYKISVLSVLTVQHLAQMKVTRQILFKKKIKTAVAATLYTFIDCTKVYFDLYLSFSQVTIIITIITTYLQCNVIQPGDTGDNYYPLTNEVVKGYSNATVRPSVTSL
jgi:hypothetical protein